MEEKMKNMNIRIIASATGAVFSNLNIFSKMDKCKNFARLFLCVFAIVGLTACGGGGGGGTSTGGGDTGDINITITAPVDQNALDDYTLEDIGDELVTAIETAIDENSATGITVVIDNNGSNTTTEITNVNANDSWKISTIAFPTLAAGSHTLGITVTYSGGNSTDSTETTANLTITVETILQTQTFTFDENSYTATAKGDTINVAISDSSGTGIISYAIANTAIASIDPITGEITPLTAGQTTISATIAADSIYDTTTATAELIVALGNQTLSFDQSSYSGTAQGNTIQVSVNSEGTGTISYSIANTDIATIDASGEITPLTAGKTTITATIAADSIYDATTANSQLTVNHIQRSISLAPATFISLDAANDTAQITITSNGITDVALYVSANIAIATVSNSGLVTAVQTGEVTITVSLPQDNTHTDATATLQVCVGMVDCDGDGLIEINSLTKLHNMRFDLSGDSYKTSDSDPGATTGCPNSGCSGYELTTNLDFDANGNGYTWSGDNATGYSLDTGDNNDDYFPIDSTTDNSAGWMPIGDLTSSFTATFDGNGYTISNLVIRRAKKNMGLFGVTSGATIRNIGLIDNLSDYTGSGGNNSIGGLIGRSVGSTIIKSHTTGNADSGAGSIDTIGGLIGRILNNSAVIASYATGNSYGAGDSVVVGGLIGHSVTNNTIIACYATGNVNTGDSADDYVGGLVGRNDDGSDVIASYATRDTDGGAGNNDAVGGLIGFNFNSGVVAATYAVGTADGGAGNSDSVGKLIGSQDSDVTPSQSYGFGDAIGDESVGVDGTTLPSGVSNATDLTADNAGSKWNSAADNTLGAWDFGDATQAPALKYADYDGDGTAYSCGDDPSDTFTTAECGTLIPGQR